MAKHLCPYGHAAVVRQDPDSDGLLGQCDTCGWSAPYIVAREQGDWQNESGELAERHQVGEEQGRAPRQLTSPIAEGEPASSSSSASSRRK